MISSALLTRCCRLDECMDLLVAEMTGNHMSVLLGRTIAGVADSVLCPTLSP